jgi:two-component system CheB/CheR fusion protein
MVRLFTPAVTGIFNLHPSDRGRPITDIANQLEDIDFGSIVHKVIEDGKSLQTKIRRRDGRAHYLMRVVPYRIGNGSVDGALVTFVDVTGLVDAEDHKCLLVAELNHRVRNMLQVVSGLASQTLKSAPTLDTFSDAFLGRVQALAIAYELLSDENWGNVTLRDLVLREVAPHCIGELRVKADGPPVLLTPKAALAFGLIFHELTTNAVKYGALSLHSGSIDISWSEQAGAPALVFVWREKNGPPAQPAKKCGFGSELISRQTRYELDGTLKLQFLDTGFIATISVPYDEHLFTLAKDTA